MAVKDRSVENTPQLSYLLIEETKMSPGKLEIADG